MRKEIFKLLLLAAFCVSSAFCRASNRQLTDIAEECGMELELATPGSITLKNKTSLLRFYPGQRKFLFKNIYVWLNGDLRKDHGEWVLPEVDMLETISPLLHPDNYLKDYKCDIVVLDPGHGGNDPGAIAASNSLLEKQMTLDIARRVAKRLRAEKLKVYLTHETDKTLQLEFRPRIAKNRKADIFVSIHLNSSTSQTASGLETYRLTASGFPSVESALEQTFPQTAYIGNGFNEANVLLGFHIQEQIQRKITTIDRGVKHARYIVLRDAPCPAVLIECGFLSNVKDAKNIASAGYRNEIANGIALGILRYRDAINHARLLANPISMGQ